MCVRNRKYKANQNNLPAKPKKKRGANFIIDSRRFARLEVYISQKTQLTFYKSYDMINKTEICFVKYYNESGRG